MVYLYQKGVFKNMGIYVNPKNTAFEFSRNSSIYVDKSMLISKLNAAYRTENRFVCVSRPRRFGKSMAANMLSAYYSCGCNSAGLFSGLEIEKNKFFQEHLNKHFVIRFDVQQFLESESDLDTFITEIQKEIAEELLEEFPDCKGFTVQTKLKFILGKIFKQTKKGFIFIIDEWDCVFRLAKNREQVQKEYLDFLRGLFKGQEYVDLAYMTGILPIKKYGEHSAINVFDEFSMIDPKNMGEYFGFTEEEVRKLCMQYHVDYFEIRKWYDGYLVGNINIYNPKSVVDVLMWKKLKSYWTGTETYEALKIYIDLNFDGLKEAVIEMLGNGRYKINPRKFQNDMTTFTGKDDVLTLLVHLGYLTFNEVTEEVSIPNQEIVQEFLNAVDNPNWGGIMQSVRCSINILKSTWSMDGKSVADGIAAIHNANASILKYNDENSLKWTILLAYYSASIYYLPPNLEFPSGKGFADVVYLPKRDIAKPALLIELKWNKSAKGAISQIRDKQYADWIKEYTGDILLVGINYDDEKGHECMIEKFVKR